MICDPSAKLGSASSPPTFLSDAILIFTTASEDTSSQQHDLVMVEHTDDQDTIIESIEGPDVQTTSTSFKQSPLPEEDHVPSGWEAWWDTQGDEVGENRTLSGSSLMRKRSFFNQTNATQNTGNSSSWNSAVRPKYTPTSHPSGKALARDAKDAARAKGKKDASTSVCPPDGMKGDKEASQRVKAGKSRANPGEGET